MVKANVTYVIDGIEGEKLPPLIALLEDYAIPERYRNSPMKRSLGAPRSVKVGNRDSLREGIILAWTSKALAAPEIRKIVLERIKVELGPELLQIFEQTDDAIFGRAKAKRGRAPAGTLFAINGGQGWFYYAQASALMDEEDLGLFTTRSRTLLPAEEVLQADIRGRPWIGHSDIWKMVRRGVWKIMGQYPCHPALQERAVKYLRPDRAYKHDPNRVWIVRRPMEGEKPDRFGLRVLSNPCWHEGAIQSVEAKYLVHFPYSLHNRLKADFNQEPYDWTIGGPLWRERIMKEINASLYPNNPRLALPEGWVPAERPPDLKMRLPPEGLVFD